MTARVGLPSGAQMAAPPPPGSWRRKGPAIRRVCVRNVPAPVKSCFAQLEITKCRSGGWVVDGRGLRRQSAARDFCVELWIGWLNLVETGDGLHRRDHRKLHCRRRFSRDKLQHLVMMTISRSLQSTSSVLHSKDADLVWRKTVGGCIVDFMYFVFAQCPM
jgi:hypothetical protein